MIKEKFFSRIENTNNEKLNLNPNPKPTTMHKQITKQITKHKKHKHKPQKANT
jgi:hypothetical protein